MTNHDIPDRAEFPAGGILPDFDFANEFAVTEYWQPYPQGSRREMESWIQKNVRRLISFLAFCRHYALNLIPTILLVFLISSTALLLANALPTTIGSQWELLPFDIITFCAGLFIWAFAVSVFPGLNKYFNLTDAGLDWTDTFKDGIPRRKIGQRKPDFFQLHFGAMRVRYTYSEKWLVVESQNNSIVACLKIAIIRRVHENVNEEEMLARGWKNESSQLPVVIEFRDKLSNRSSILIIHGAAFRSSRHRTEFCKGLSIVVAASTALPAGDDGSSQE